MVVDSQQKFHRLARHRAGSGTSADQRVCYASTAADVSDVVTKVRQIDRIDEGRLKQYHDLRGKFGRRVDPRDGGSERSGTCHIASGAGAGQRASGSSGERGCPTCNGHSEISS